MYIKYREHFLHFLFLEFTTSHRFHQILSNTLFWHKSCYSATQSLPNSVNIFLKYRRFTQRIFTCSIPCFSVDLCSTHFRSFETFLLNDGILLKLLISWYEQDPHNFGNKLSKANNQGTSKNFLYSRLKFPPRNLEKQY